MIKRIGFLLLGMFFTFQTIVAAAFTNDKFEHPFYFGATGGYGSTTWGNLVAKEPSFSMNLITPINVSEGGGIWGLFAGYEFTPRFAFEGSYTHYPNANLTFHPTDSMFIIDHVGNTMVSKTEVVAAMLKLMLVIPHTTIRGFSSFGAAYEHRDDIIKNIWRLGPTFGVGLDYNLTPHWMIELAGNYVAGYGQAQIDPTQGFVPFLYSGYLRLGYRV